MSWSQDRPTTPGYYWLLRKGNRHPSPVLLDDDEYVSCLDAGENTWIGSPTLDGARWFGPVQPPEEGAQ